MIKNKFYKYAFLILSCGAVIFATYLNHNYFRAESPARVDSNYYVMNTKDLDTGDVTDRIPLFKDIESEESTSEEELSEEDIDETAVPEGYDASIYNTEVISNNGIEPLDTSQYASIDELIWDIIHQYGVYDSQIGLAYYNFQTDEHFYINPDNYMIAASTSKVPVAALYVDLINEGVYTYDTHLPFNADYYVEGAGSITNSPLQSSYSISDLMFESLAHSDNTAWYTMAFNFINNYDSVRQGILNFAEGMSNVPSHYYSDNYTSAALTEKILIKIASNPAYEVIIDIMRQAQPNQLFTSYVNVENMPVKYGRLDAVVNDSGIYYENGEPQYVLVVLTDNVDYADGFLEILNLRINEWFRANYIQNS